MIRHAGSPGDAYRMDIKEKKQAFPNMTPSEEKALKEAANGPDPDSLWEPVVSSGMKFVSVLDPDYPKRLLAISSPPICLYYYGKLPSDSAPAVAIVGARACSSYGKLVASEFGRQLGEQKIQVISGMAAGIDSISQNAAVDAGGYSAGVLGCGCDICYPKENRRLYEKLKETGAVISERYPSAQPLKQFFPARNRIISGLSQAVLVVEARVRSGSLITADMALEQGRDVYAVPGRVNENLSAGCNRLIKQGAGMAITPREFVEDLLCENYIEEDLSKESHQGKSVLEIKRPRGLDEGESIIWDALTTDPRSVDQIYNDISNRLVISLPGLIQVLLRMCLKGAAKQISATYFTK
ncbi:MAG: DNA-processing protein DprA [Lachnospiraceae bacterium]|nr:DNA-processing protein DprA [Lachnospiraceae bacterium]